MEIATWFGRIDSETGSVFLAEDGERMIDALLKKPLPAGPSVQPDLRRLALMHGYAADDIEYNARLREIALGLVRRQLAQLATTEQDLLQAVEAIDDMTEAINLLDERLYEWHRLHHQRIVHGKDLAELLCEDRIMGPFARSILRLMESRKSMEEEVSFRAEELAPNLSALAGPILAARLISRAGGLSRLAKMPSSRVQVMGAEKSLFKHLDGHAPSPKHGIIFRHPAVMGAPRRLRGKVARALAGKLALAARLDYYGASPSPDLAASLERRLNDIKRRGGNRKESIRLAGERNEQQG
ncbi:MULTISPECIES: ATP-binding protein [Methanothrix]|uniref:Putative snoRNA binding domain protein n=1 Tax=Methanothrix soehngenii (strain ATCC 5969 / DSM 3671 / JCM 10134 / NBRC 103675 / OCM 69 / GP-6) TaxID=990316 RepID=F4BTJ1_METSG|nr:MULTISPECIES: ATP-binding protein [Methanothrix]AEB68196.1 Putative snoRNA binding domain protein [Methanothrix soehngenii GP6]